MKLVVVGFVLVLSILASAQARTQPCKEAAEAVALGRMLEKYGDRMTDFFGPNAYEQVGPNGKEYYIVSFHKGSDDGATDYTSVLVTTWDPEKKTGNHRCVISDVFGPTTDRDPAGPKVEILPDDPR